MSVGSVATVGTTSATSGTIVAVAIVSVFVVAAALMIVQRLTSKRLLSTADSGLGAESNDVDVSVECVSSSPALAPTATVANPLFGHGDDH